MAANTFDIIIVGGGPGGYVTAIRSSQLGFRTCLVEKQHLGGICLNWGCIPTKALMKNAEVFELVKNANKYGITVGDVTVNWKKMIKRSRDVAKRLSKGVEYLIKKNKIDYIPAYGRLTDNSTVEITDSKGKKIQVNHAGSIFRFTVCSLVQRPVSKIWCAGNKKP